MKLLKSVDDLEQTDEFLGWSSKNPNCFLAHIFKMEDDIQIGYYNSENSRITTFSFGDGEIKINPDSEPFKPEDKSLLPLDREKIKIDDDQALQIARDLAKEKYPKEMEQKTFMILQNLEIGQVYNITILTHAFKTINIKVSTEDGKVLFDDLISVFDFKAK
ncbi:hypothetical protein K9M79_08620 [Candidatus Woesearchaeota archaeon]|nr:hypothetical protein [Candidatus Woesearchaeota archaeon]